MQGNAQWFLEGLQEGGMAGPLKSYVHARGFDFRALNTYIMALLIMDHHQDSPTLEEWGNKRNICNSDSNMGASYH